MKDRASTPKKRIPDLNTRAPRRESNKQRKASARELETAKKRLEEGLHIGLGPDSSFDSNSYAGKDDTDNGGMLENVYNNQIELEPRENAGNLDEEENISANYPEFETTSSSILNELRMILSELSGNDNSDFFDSSDPDLTGALAGMIGDQDKKISTPFQLCERIRQELIARAEQAGSRALNWSLSQFNRVGGESTVRSVWRRLKSLQVVRGEKRVLSLSMSEEEEQGDTKKLKISLNISGTCDLIDNIELSNTQENSLDASQIVVNDREDVEEDNWSGDEVFLDESGSSGRWGVRENWHVSNEESDS